MIKEEYEHILSLIIENGFDALENKDSSEFQGGRRMAYYEVLDTIKDWIEIYEGDIKEFGLDVDLESFRIVQE